MCKADISFLLNPPTEDYDVKVVVPPSSPSTTLFRSLSSIMQSPKPTSPSTSYQRRLINSCIDPREKRFNSMRSYGDKAKLPMLSLAALCVNEPFLPIPEVATVKPHPRKTHTPPCRVEGCKNLAVSRGCCVRHGGGSKCTEPGCNKRAKLYQRCFQHGGYKMCTEPGCTKKAKRYGHCWSHGGGHICEAPECTKVSTQGGFCWAHGGGNRCKHEGCNRRSYQKYDYYCLRHAPRDLVASTTVGVAASL
ncbi:putative WRKY transcription factor 19 [Phytophthora citrophthora]|uniref:WRKY transcription factor 19 n=1 Tax=Phytophthora citrophthora TaxID=4793 RepID=A0AAD9GRS2_9STRA|nr:putative WRKY transcription factor 19 [Phytophthora citrophthora]